MNHIIINIACLLLIGIFASISVFNCYYSKNVIKDYFGDNVNTIILILVVIALFYVFSNRDTYLPFLGPTVLPTSVFKDYRQEKFDKKISVEVTNDHKMNKPIKIVYWAAGKSADEKLSPQDAYKNFENYGVSPIINNTADLYIQCPSSYIVTRFGHIKHLPKHLHYRILYENGMLSEIKTQTITDCS